DAARDVERAIVDEPEVARAQERPVAVAGERLEGLGRARALSPVPAGDAGARDPDLAHRPGLASPAGVRIDDAHPGLAERRAAADQGARARSFARLRPALGERFLVGDQHRRLLQLAPA